MDDKQQIETLYKQMYQAMIAKDTATLNQVHADEFVLTHMTGMRQSKAVYIQSIANGTLNYYSAEHEQMDIWVDGNLFLYLSYNVIFELNAPTISCAL